MRQSSVGLAFQKTNLSEVNKQGPGNVKANESAEADQWNLLYKANELNQRNEQAKAAVVEHKQQGPGNVKANESAEADQWNLLYKANELNQRNEQSKAAVVEHKQRGAVKKLRQCCLEEI